MKANELRIGNYVNTISSKALPVFGVFRETIWLDCGDYNVDHNIEEIYPILLTEEWLKKFGCLDNPMIGDTKINYWNREMDFSIDVDIVSSSNGVQPMFYYLLAKNRRKHLVYVHDLQNLHFALKGKELVPTTEKEL